MNCFVIIIYSAFLIRIRIKIRHLIIVKVVKRTKCVVKIE